MTTQCQHRRWPWEHCEWCERFLMEREPEAPYGTDEWGTPPSEQAEHARMADTHPADYDQRRRRWHSALVEDE